MASEDEALDVCRQLAQQLGGSTAKPVQSYRSLAGARAWRVNSKYNKRAEGQLGSVGASQGVTFPKAAAQDQARKAGRLPPAGEAAGRPDTQASPEPLLPCRCVRVPDQAST